MSTKKESIEWEKEVNDFRNGVQDAPDTDEYIRENLPRVLSKAIASAVEARGDKIMDIMKAKSIIYACGDECGDCLCSKGYEEAVDDLEAININPSKE